MCMIVIAQQGKRIRSEDVTDAVGYSNTDGVGVAWTEGGRVRWIKGLDTKQAKRLVKTLRAVNGPVVLHARLATVGGKGGALCHPFPVEPGARTDVVGNADAVLLHNGHWSAWDDIAELVGVGREGWSDSRLLAHLVAVYGADAASRVLGYSGRVVTLNGAGELRLWGNGWTEERGLTWSSTPFRYSKGGGTYGAYTKGVGYNGGTGYGRGAATSADARWWAAQGDEDEAGDNEGFVAGKRDGFRKGSAGADASENSEGANEQPRSRELTAVSRVHGADPNGGCHCSGCEAGRAWRAREAAEQKAAAADRFHALRTMGVVGGEGR